jgi:hypothetical protein
MPPSAVPRQLRRISLPRTRVNKDWGEATRPNRCFPLEAAACFGAEFIIGGHLVLCRFVRIRHLDHLYNFAATQFVSNRFVSNDPRLFWIVRFWKNLSFIQLSISRTIWLTAAIIQFVALRERERPPYAALIERVSKPGEPLLLGVEAPSPRALEGPQISPSAESHRNGDCSCRWPCSSRRVPTWSRR